MSCKSKSHLILLVSVLLSFRAFASGEKFSAKVEPIWGLYVIRFDTPDGRIKVFLPKEVNPGTKVSGIMVLEPTGKDDIERQRRKEKLNSYEVELGGNKVQVVDGNFKLSIPSELETVAAYISLKDENKVEQIRVVIPLGKRVETDLVKEPLEQWMYKLPGVGYAGKLVEIEGPFDGDFETTKLKMGDREINWIVESPTGLFFRSPSDITGSTQLELREGDIVIKRRFSNLPVVKIRKGTEKGLGSKQEDSTPIESKSGVSTKPLPLINKSGYTVQIASFRKEDEALELAKSLRAKGIPAFVRQARIKGKGTWYRVRVGEFKTLEEARSYGQYLKEHERGFEFLFVTIND
jgi:hypothetical protein